MVKIKYVIPFLLSYHKNIYELRYQKTLQNANLQQRLKFLLLQLSSRLGGGATHGTPPMISNIEWQTCIMWVCSTSHVWLLQKDQSQRKIPGIFQEYSTNIPPILHDLKWDAGKIMKSIICNICNMFTPTCNKICHGQSKQSLFFVGGWGWGLS